MVLKACEGCILHVRANGFSSKYLKIANVFIFGSFPVLNAFPSKYPTFLCLKIMKCPIFPFSESGEYVRFRGISRKNAYFQVIVLFETQIIEYWNEDLEDSESKYFQALSSLYLTAFANTINEPVELETDSKISLFQFLSIRIVKFSFICNESERQCIRSVFTSQTQ